MLFLADFNIALVAQSVEHLHGKEGVVGSNPTEGYRFTVDRELCFVLPYRSFWVVLECRQGSVEYEQGS